MSLSVVMRYLEVALAKARFQAEWMPMLTRVFFPFIRLGSIPKSITSACFSKTCSFPPKWITTNRYLCFVLSRRYWMVLSVNWGRRYAVIKMSIVSGIIRLACFSGDVRYKGCLQTGKCGIYECTYRTNNDPGPRDSPILL